MKIAAKMLILSAIPVLGLTACTGDELYSDADVYVVRQRPAMVVREHPHYRQEVVVVREPAQPPVVTIRQAPPQPVVVRTEPSVRHYHYGPLSALRMRQPEPAPVVTVRPTPRFVPAPVVTVRPAPVVPAHPPVVNVHPNPGPAPVVIARRQAGAVNVQEGSPSVRTVVREEPRAGSVVTIRPGHQPIHIATSDDNQAPSVTVRPRA